MKAVIFALLAMLALSGCAAAAAKGANLGLSALSAVEARAQEAVIDRRELRAQEREINAQIIQGYRAEAEIQRRAGNFDGWLAMMEKAKAAIRDAMPGLDSVRAEIDQLLGEDPG